MPRVFVMLVRFIAEIVADIHVFPDDVCNSDTIGDYATELNCSVGNDALHYLSAYLNDDAKDIKILAAEPTDEGIDEYNEHLNNWQGEYNRRMQKYERKRV